MGQNNDEGNKGSEMAVGGRRRESDEHGEDLMEEIVYAYMETGGKRRDVRLFNIIFLFQLKQIETILRERKNGRG